jgi:hypothetical protein
VTDLRVMSDKVLLSRAHIVRHVAAKQPETSMRNRLLLRAALAATLTATLGACASVRSSIPERAWRNGEAMSQSNAYSRAMSGDLSLGTQMKLRSSANPRYLNHREVNYPAFGRWDY